MREDERTKATEKIYNVVTKDFFSSRIAPKRSSTLNCNGLVLICEANEEL